MSKEIKIIEAQICCIPQVSRVYVCSDCEEEFDSESEAVSHIHNKKLLEGEPTLGEWATEIETEVVYATD